MRNNGIEYWGASVYGCIDESGDGAFIARWNLNLCERVFYSFSLADSTKREFRSGEVTIQN